MNVWIFLTVNTYMGRYATSNCYTKPNFGVYHSKAGYRTMNSTNHPKEGVQGDVIQL